MSKRWRGRIVILTVLLLAAMALVAIPASADMHDDERSVRTYGEVAGGGSSALIVCKWELPDANPDRPGIQYGGDFGRYGKLGAGHPCRLGDGYPEYVQQGRPVIGVYALPHDLYDDGIPARQIELWSAVTTASGPGRVDDVYWDIYHPDGTPKDQVHGDPIALETADQYGVRWDGSQYQVVGGMWEAASPGTAQVTEEAVGDRNYGLVQAQMQGRIDLWRATFDLHKHQPCGPYRIENHTIVDGADEDWLTNYIWVHCFIDLQTDFDRINWGLLTPDDVKYLNGNTDWGDYTTDGAFGSQFMTVGNGGPQGMVVGVAFAPLVQQVEEWKLPKLITHFDAKFGMNSSALQTIDPIYSSEEPEKLGEVAWFENDYYRTVCANEMFKLDLSVHVPSITPNGDYVGAMKVFGMGELGKYTGGNNGDVVTTTTDETPPDNGPYGICNNSNGVWDLNDPGNQRTD